MLPRLRYIELPSKSGHSSVLGPVTRTNPAGPPLNEQSTEDPCAVCQNLGAAKAHLHDRTSFVLVEARGVVTTLWIGEQRTPGVDVPYARGPPILAATTENTVVA